MSNIRIESSRKGWRVCHGETLVLSTPDEVEAFQAALDYCSKLFLDGVRAQVILDKPPFDGRRAAA